MICLFRFTLFFNLAFTLFSMLFGLPTHVARMVISPSLLLRAPSSCTRRGAHRTVRIENEMRTIRSAKVFDCFIFDHGPQIRIRKGDSSERLSANTESTGSTPCHQQHYTRKPRLHARSVCVTGKCVTEDSGTTVREHTWCGRPTVRAVKQMATRHATVIVRAHARANMNRVRSIDRY